MYKKIFPALPLLTMIWLIYGNLHVQCIYFGDLTVEFINESYVDLETFDISSEYRRDGKNAVNFHANLTQDTPLNIRLKSTVSDRIFGNYVPTGLSVDDGVCQHSGNMAEYIDRLLAPLGFHCSMKMGSYHRGGFLPDLTDLPINIVSRTHFLFDVLLYRPSGIEVLIMKG